MFYFPSFKRNLQEKQTCITLRNQLIIYPNLNKEKNMKSLSKHLPHFTGSPDQKQYHQGLRSTLNPEDSNMNAMDNSSDTKQTKKPLWSMHKQGKSQQQARKASTGSFSDDDLAAMPVEKQFETDYDKTGHLVPDTEHFTSEQDMVGASNEEFHHPTM